MDRIIVEHVSGEKANQRESFPTDAYQSLLFGRDLAAQIRFSDGSDSVSRQHASLEVDPASPNTLKLKDLGGRNGLFLNGAPVTGVVVVHHGDRIQLGAAGPEVVIKFDPEPPPVPKPTREVTTPAATTEVRIPVATASAAAAPGATAAAPAAGAGPRPVGRETVERLIVQQKTATQRSLGAWIGGVALIAVAGIGGALIYNQKSVDKANAEIAKTQQAAVQANKAAADAAATAQADAKRLEDQQNWKSNVVSKYKGAVVYITMNWHLVHAGTRQPVYHAYKTVEDKGKTYSLPMYLVVTKGVLEPLLTTQSGGGNKAIGASGTGTGFVVDPRGFILTSRHVAANWMTSMPAILMCPCIIREGGQDRFEPEVTPELQQAISGWVPAKSEQVGSGVGKTFIGENLLLDITFVDQKSTVAGRLVQISDEHDVAMIRVDTVQDLTAVQLASQSDADHLSEGSEIMTMGYPGVSPTVYAVTNSKDMFNKDSDVSVVAKVSSTNGMLSKIIKPDFKTGEQSVMRDSYQTTINATGPGNSGGPVFDQTGKVIAVFYAANEKVTFAVPIKYGRELMGPSATQN